MEDVIQLYEQFSEQVSDFIRLNYYPLYSMLIVFNLFEFYLFHKDYLNELTDVFEKSEQVKFMGEER